MPDSGLRPVLIERLGRDHARIAGVVREVADLVDAIGQPDWQRLEELLEFLHYFADRVHHPLEDRLFDHLIHKGLTPTERHLVFRNLSQHEEIRALTDSISERISTALANGAVDVDDFREVVAGYLDLQRRHMRFEENQLFPLIEGAFDNSDWNTVMRLVESAQESGAVQGEEGTEQPSGEMTK
jgi:hemerythrin-like domain-containing protein